MSWILIIEDDELTRKFIRDIVKSMGHDILCAEDGAAGLRLIAEQKPDVILSDLKVPNQPSELELIKALRATCPQTPIVVISGYPYPETMQECIKLGVADFLTKPFEIDFVTSILQRMLEPK